MKEKDMKHIGFDRSSFHDKRCSDKYSVEVNARIMLGKYDGLGGWFKKQMDRLRYPNTPAASYKNMTVGFNYGARPEQIKGAQNIPASETCSCERSPDVLPCYPDAPVANKCTSEILDLVPYNAKNTNKTKHPQSEPSNKIDKIQPESGHKIVRHAGGTHVIDATTADERNQPILKRQ